MSMSYLPAGIGPCGCTRYEINPDGGTERSFFTCRDFFRTVVSGRPVRYSARRHSRLRTVSAGRNLRPGTGCGGAAGASGLRTQRCGWGGFAVAAWYIGGYGLSLRSVGEGGCAAAGGFPEKTRSGRFIRRGEIPGFRRRTAGATAFPNRKPNRIRYDELFV